MQQPTIHAPEAEENLLTLTDNSCFSYAAFSPFTSGNKISGMFDTKLSLLLIFVF
jgi:hypothetical protein